MKERYPFITFEGVDGSGKGTQINLLADWLLRQNKYLHFFITHEPTTTTKEGQEIARLLRQAVHIDPQQIAELFVADRHQHTALFRPLLPWAMVLSDRYDISTFAYQGCALGFEKIYQMHRFNKPNGALLPDFTVILDVSLATWERTKKRRAPREYWETEERLRKAINCQNEALAWWQENHPERRFALVPGEGQPEEVHRQVVAAVMPVLKEFQLLPDA